MSLFTADPERCRRDGVCVAECPVRIIELPDGARAPIVRSELEEFCRNCGHCVAVCGQDAVRLATMPTEVLPRVRGDWPPTTDEVTHFLRARRSIRAYLPRRVPREMLSALVEVASFAPTGSNRQPVRWVMIDEPAEVRRLAGLVAEWMRAGLPKQPAAARRNIERFVAQWDAGTDMICRGAPHIIWACASQENPAWATDCAIALTYLELAAPSFGLGACWGGWLMAAARQWGPLQQALGVPEGLAPHGAMLIGYPRYRYHRLPLRNAPQIYWHGEAQGS